MASHQVKESISLLPAEAELFETLLAAARTGGAKTVLRCAGGWVRDKLLARESPDIDIALDDMMGKDFADKVNAWLLSQGKATSRAAVIMSNPDQSKHLETARMKIDGLELDLVNLRSETYAEGSRIPTMEFGSPTDDALRRDFTVNSMFYNINTGAVEDFTGRGMDDLRAGIIRTPLPAAQTFMDDPLRVLRGVRFATRFDFKLEPTLMEAASSQEVRAALSNKVSRERFGSELEGMFKGPAPMKAMRMLNELLLFPVVFAVPEQLAARLGPRYGDACVSCLAAADQLLLHHPQLQLEPEQRRFYLLAALLLPLRGCSVTGAKKAKTPQAAAAYVARESIKWRAKDGDMAVALAEVAADLLAVHRRLGSAGDSSGADAAAVPASADVRVALGLAIRKLKEHWRLGALLAPLLTCQAAAPLGVEDGGGGGGARGGAASPSSAGEGGAAGASDMSEAATLARREMSNELLAAAEAFQVADCWQWKPLMDGNQITAALELKKGDRALGTLMASLVEWHLAHPGGTAEGALEHLRSVHKN